MNDNKVISIIARDRNDVTLVHTHKDYTKKITRQYEVPYYRLDMTIFYKMMVGTRLQLLFAEYMLHDNFVFRGMDDIYKSCHMKEGGSIKTEAPPYLVAEMLYYDYGVEEDVRINGYKYQLIRNKRGDPVDLMGTPFVYSTRRTMTRRILGREFGGVS